MGHALLLRQAAGLQLLLAQLLLVAGELDLGLADLLVLFLLAVEGVVQVEIGGLEL